MQAKPQTAAVHAGAALTPVGHAVPHVAQLAMSVCRLWQVPPQFDSPTEQHAPERHGSPAAHTWPQVPQLLMSFNRSRHAELQAFIPVGQLQTPFVQLAPVGHAWPQVPQLLTSVRTSPPLSMMPSQSLSMPSQCSAPSEVHEHTLPEAPAAQTQFEDAGQSHMPRHSAEQCPPWQTPLVQSPGTLQVAPKPCAAGPPPSTG